MNNEKIAELLVPILNYQGYGINPLTEEEITKHLLKDQFLGQKPIQKMIEILDLQIQKIEETTHSDFLKEEAQKSLAEILRELQNINTNTFKENATREERHLLTKQVQLAPAYNAQTYLEVLALELIKANYYPSHKNIANIFWIISMKNNEQINRELIKEALYVFTKIFDDDTESLI